MLLKRVLKKTAQKYRAVGFLPTVKWFLVCAKLKLRLMKCPTSDYYYIKNSKAERDITPKPLPGIFICAGVPYYDIGGGQRSSQLAKTFNAMGYAVFYFYAFPSSEASPCSIPLPLCAHHVIEYDTPQRIGGHVTADDIFIFESPAKAFEPMLALAQKKRCKIVYESIDNWETELGNGIFSPDTLGKMLRSADLLVATAKPLAAQLKGYLRSYCIPNKEVLYLPNAVDTELFCPLRSHGIPDGMKQGKATLIYFGSLWGSWFDWELIFDLAKKHPEYCINLIGDHSHIPEKVTQAPYNIRFLGLKPHRELPAYLSCADFAIIPFKTGEISDCVSPLKVFEYIAMGKRVLSTCLPDIEGYPNVCTGSSAEEWEKLIEAPPAPVDTEEFVRSNSWYSRAAAILSRTAPSKPSPLKGKLSVIVLNRNNKNVIFRCIGALISHRGDVDYDIIVVDNCSTDGSAEMLKDSGLPITLLRNSKNGCASGRNLGVAHSPREFILFLDSDQWPLSDDWLRPYERVMESHPDFGIIGWAAGFFDRMGKAHHVVDSFPHRYMPPNGLARRDIGYLGSGGMLLRRNVFLSVGGFDINYDPTCYEDTDLSLKVRHMGKEIYYCPYGGIFHLPHQTTKSGSDSHRAVTELKQKYFTEKWKSKNPDLLKYIK